MSAVIVEDGTGLSDSDSYISAADCATYASNRGLAFDANDPGADAALRRATAYIDAKYRGRFPGYPTQLGIQALEWPRYSAYLLVPEQGRNAPFFYGMTGNYDYNYEFIGGFYYIPSNAIPRQIITAVCEGAIRELASPSSLAPDLDRGNAIVRLQAGSVSVQYGANASPVTTFQVIDLALASLLMPSNAFGARAVRG